MNLLTAEVWALGVAGLDSDALGTLLAAGARDAASLAAGFTQTAVAYELPDHTNPKR